MSDVAAKKPEYAIRFGLGAIKAVGMNTTEKIVEERNSNGLYKDVYDFALRLDPKYINKKSIEALSKSGSFDSIHNNRQQIFESFDILSAYAAKQAEDNLSNQMSLFDGFAEALKKPALKNVESWNEQESIQKEFEAFGFFLNKHPLNDYVTDLKKRGVIFSDKIERDELKDGDVVKISGVVAASKHRSSARGRFAYLTMSDPFGIFEILIFDEQLITRTRDIITDGSMIVAECAIKKDEGGMRILTKDIKRVVDYINNVTAKDEIFEDIRNEQPQFKRSENKKWNNNKESNSEEKKFTKKPYNKPSDQSSSTSGGNLLQSVIDSLSGKKIIKNVQIIIKDMAPILGVKSFLSQKPAPSILIESGDQANNIKLSEVHFIIMQQGKISKVLLPKKYLLEDKDVASLRKIAGVVDVEWEM